MSGKVTRKQEVLNVVEQLHREGKAYVTRADVRKAMGSLYLKTSHSGAITALKNSGVLVLRPGSKPEEFQLRGCTMVCDRPSLVATSKSTTAKRAAPAKRAATSTSTAKTVAGRKRPATTPSMPAKSRTKIETQRLQRRSKRRARERRSDSWKSYETYIYRVLKAQFPKMSISAKAMETLNDMVLDLIRRYMAVADSLTREKKTLTYRDVATLTRLLLTGELAKHALRETERACKAYLSREKQSGGPTQRAGLIFPVTRVGNAMRRMRPTGRQSTSAAVALAAVLQYVIEEIVEMSGYAASNMKRLRISPRHIALAVHNDDEVHRLFGDAIVARAGVAPHIHPALLPAKSKK